MTYEEADRRFGTDKPDTRFGLEIEDATEATRGSEFGVFGGAEAVRFLRVPQAFSRAELARLEEVAKEWGAKGLAYVVARRGRGGALADRQVPVRGRARRARACSRARRCSSPPTAGRRRRACSRALRLQLGRELGLIDDGVVHVPLGDGLPDVRVGRGRAALRRRAPPVHAADRRVEGALRRRARGTRSRTRTTSSSTATSSAAAPSGSTSPRSRPRCSTCCG